MGPRESQPDLDDWVAAPWQRGVTTHGTADNSRELRSPNAHHNRWLWAKLLLEEYLSEGYFMNTTGLRTTFSSWFRLNNALRDIPKRLTMLLSSTDNRRNHSDEVEELQSRAREYTRQQLEQMDDWDRAFYREWTSLVSRNALASPYPMGEPMGSSKVKLRRSSQRRSVATREISPQVRAHAGRDFIISSPRRSRTNQLGRHDPREQRVFGQDGGISIHTTIASRTWNSDTLPRRTVLRRDRATGRTRMVVTGEFIPEEQHPRVSAINVGTLKATTSDEDKYCMLDSGANVMVVPLMRDMKGDKTMCSLVGDNKTQGLIISRLYTKREHI